MWLLVNANGYTMNAARNRFEAAVVDQGRITAVGTTEALRLQYGARAERILDVEGATVVPGFVDSHLHVAGVGEQAVQLDLFGVRSKQQMLDRIAAYAPQKEADAWVVGAGWDDNQFVDRTLPTLAELDAASGGRPLLLRRICCHAYLANSAAMALGGLQPNTQDLPDGRYGRDDRGDLNGQLYENAAAPVLAAVPRPSRAQWREAIRAGMQTCLQVGITAVHTDDVRNLRGFAQVWETYFQLIHEEGVRLRVHELVDWHYMDDCIEAMKHLPKPGEWMEIGAAKLFSDGALGGRTAWFLDEYSDTPGWQGQPMYTRDELTLRVRMAHEKGFSAAIHAIGDAGLDATLAALEAAPKLHKRDRVVHAEIVNPSLVSRMAALGDSLAVDIQPRFAVSDFPWIAERIGPDRLPYACAWRTLKQAGLYLAGGSDAPIEPVEPLLGMHAAVARRLPFSTQEGHSMEQALTPEEAVALFTKDACFANASEHVKGVVAPGWMADFTILDRDIVNPRHLDDIRDAKVLYTIVGGHIAYDASGRGAEWSA